MPLETLLSDVYNAERMQAHRRARLARAAAGHHRQASASSSPCSASPARAPQGRPGAGEPTVGKLWTHDDTRDPSAAAIEDAKLDRAGAMRGDTVHFDIIDRDGNMVSSTPSGGWLQSSPVIPELGFCLGTRAQMFWLDEEHPAALAPGKRPRTTLTPTMALRDGEPYLAWGSPGGDQQDQWITQFFLRHVHAGMNLQEAIDAPAWHSEHFPVVVLAAQARPGVLVVEGRARRGDDRGAAPPRPRGRGRPRLVGRPADGGLAQRQPPQGRRQSARHAGLRGGAIALALDDGERARFVCV